MTTIYNINHANKNVQWTEDLVRSKLQALGNMNGKKISWIRSDLSLKKSNRFTRLIWSVVAKHFSWMRKHLFGVNLKQSRSLLRQIGNKLPHNSTIYSLYIQAVDKFNHIAPQHAFDPKIELINAHPEVTLKQHGFDTKEKVLAFVETHGNKLKSLNLTNIQNIENTDIEKFIGYCPNLNYLFIGNSKIDDRTLSLITNKLTSLQTLDLSHCYRISDAGLENLKPLTSLQTLSLSDCYRITDAGLKNLKPLTSLQTLYLSYCEKITGAGLENLIALTSLQNLVLSNCEKITDAGLKNLKPLTSLQYLNLSFCKKISDAGLENLKALTSLQTLILAYCYRITGAGLKNVKALTSLQTLNLINCEKITDAGLKNLKALTSLQTLYLNNCEKITDAGLKNLKALTSLQDLVLSNCEKITDAGIKKLIMGLPRLIRICHPS